MYTGYYLNLKDVKNSSRGPVDRQIYGPHGITIYSLDEACHMVGPDGYTGFSLKISPFPNEDAVTDEGAIQFCNVDGFTDFFMVNGRIYGPSPWLPWEKTNSLLVK